MADMEAKIREILGQAAEAIAQALIATEEGDMERAGELEGNADQLTARADKMKALVAKQKAFTAPVMPASLPQDSPSNGTLLTTAVTDPPAANSPADVQKAAQAAAQKAVYQMRFGEMDSGIKSVMMGLYGSDYESKRLRQWDGFVKFMRHQDHLMTKAHWDVGRTLIMTPAYIEQALAAGQDYAALKATMVEASDTLGGYIVPVDFQSRVITRLAGLTVMRGRATPNTTSSDRVQITVATGGDSQHTSAIREVWVDETPTSSAADTNLTFGLEDVNINNAMAVVPLSKNLLEDAGFNLVDNLIKHFSDAAKVNEDNTFLTGDGAGKPQGILPGSLNALSLGEVNSGNATALTFDGLLGLFFALDTQYAEKAEVLAEKATWLAISKLKDGDGAYLWTELRGDNVSGSPKFIRGFPVLQQEAMPTIAANAYPIIFGDFSGYEIWDRVGMSVTRFDVNPGENILKYEMRRRLGGQVTEPWKFKVQKVSA